MEMNTDTPDTTYWLSDDFLFSPLVSHLEEEMDRYKGLGRHYLDDGQAYIVYSMPLLGFLISPEVKANIVKPGHLFDGPATTIKGTDYKPSYVEGYEEGIRFFQKEYLVSPDIIYNNQDYINTLYERCFVTTHKGSIGGWYAQAHSTPLTVCHAQIREHGYWTGIYSQVEELRNKYKPIEDALNKSFKAAELPNKPAVQIEKQINLSSASEIKFTEREKALIYCYKQLPPISKGQPLYNDYITLTTPKKRIAYPNESLKKAKSLIASIEKIMPKLTDSERKQAENEINTIEAKFSN
ncbi:hypothetical protein GCM10028805_25980 [Spirosoma harenae]